MPNISSSDIKKAQYVEQKAIRAYRTHEDLRKRAKRDLLQRISGVHNADKEPKTTIVAHLMEDLYGRNWGDLYRMGKKLSK